MADLDAELQAMLVQNWGLLHRLHERAEAIRKDLLVGAANEIRQRELATGDRSLEVASGYTYVKLPATPKAWSYVQIDVPRDLPTLAVKVWTGFTGATGSYAPIKKHVGAKFAASFGTAWYGGADRVETVRELIAIPVGMDGVTETIAAAVERQLEVAEAVRAYLRQGPG